MPGTRRTQGNNGPIPKPWNDLASAISNNAVLSQASAVQTGQWVLDQYQNSPVIVGNLNQVVTIGAGWITGNAVTGVQIGTGLTGFGIGYLSAFAHTTVTTTQGSTSATVASSSGFVNGMVIGATLLEAPSYPPTALPPNYIAPGTTMTFSGTSVTLSSDALLSGTGLYCVVASFTKLNVDAHP